jgi:hypothetical protein
VHEVSRLPFACRWPRQSGLRIKRLCLPAAARRIAVEQPGITRATDGTRVYGVAIRYEELVLGSRARTVYCLPEWRAERTTVVALPRDATRVRLVDRAPQPGIAVA